VLEGGIKDLSFVRQLGEILNQEVKVFSVNLQDPILFASNEEVEEDVWCELWLWLWHLG